MVFTPKGELIILNQLKTNDNDKKIIVVSDSGVLSRVLRAGKATDSNHAKKMIELGLEGLNLN
ncbi:MAG: hypothetical protein H8E46_01700 [FCB group bacterium]|nr:hypothetical protein [FCB group bacterium]